MLNSSQRCRHLTKIMQIHRRLNEILASAGEPGIAETLSQLTGFGVVIHDEAGRVRATAGEANGSALAELPPGQRRKLLRELRITARPVYHGPAWLALASPRAGIEGVIALIDPARGAGRPTWPRCSTPRPC